MFFKCYWHGCPVHYVDEDERIAHGQTVKSVRERDAKREEEIRQSGLDIMVKWECEIQRKMEMSFAEHEAEWANNYSEDQILRRLEAVEEMCKFMDEQDDAGPIEVCKFY